jgi:DedD protein
MFKFRFGPAAAPAAAQPSTLDAIRRRARHRLIGASVLVLVGVIGLPWLFDTQPRPIPVDLAIDIPAKDALPPLSLPAPAAVSVAPAPVPAPAATVPAPASAPLAPVAPAVQAPLPVPPPVPAPPAAPAKAASSAAPEASRAQALLEGQPPVSTERLVVQVGAFADEARAREVRLRVERAGLKTYTQVAKTAEGARIRVRVGPFASRAEADRAADKIRTLGLPAVVLTL